MRLPSLTLASLLGDPDDNSDNYFAHFSRISPIDWVESIPIGASNERPGLGPAPGTGPGPALHQLCFQWFCRVYYSNPCLPPSFHRLKAPSKEPFSRIFNAGSIERLVGSVHSECASADKMSSKNWLRFFPRFLSFKFEFYIISYKNLEIKFYIDIVVISCFQLLNQSWMSMYLTLRGETLSLICNAGTLKGFCSLDKSYYLQYPTNGNDS